MGLGRPVSSTSFACRSSSSLRVCRGRQAATARRNAEAPRRPLARKRRFSRDARSKSSRRSAASTAPSKCVRRNDRGNVKQGPVHSGNPDPVVHLEVRLIHHSRDVHPEPTRGDSSSRRGDFDPIRAGQKTPEMCGRTMAESCSGPAREYRCQISPPHRDRAMPHRINPAVKGVKPTVFHASMDRHRVEAEGF
jgi:hypothetical protein